MQTPTSGSARVAFERILITVLFAAYLVTFRQNVPHGDALRIVSQIESATLNWNPNHLLFDPIGYALYRLFEWAGVPITVLGAFELISGASTIASLWVFHVILCQIGVRGAIIRVLVVAALFSSAAFLAVAVSQYYFMVQMPFLLGAIHQYFSLQRRISGEPRVGRPEYAMGALLAIATTIMVSNIFLVFVGAVSVTAASSDQNGLNMRNAARLLMAAGAIGFPVFIAGYALSDSHADMFTWLLSYEGKEDGGLNAFYGIKWTLPGILQGVSMVGFNLLIGSLVDSAGFGTVLSVWAFGYEFEFIPQWHRIILAMTALPVIVLMNCGVAFFTLRCFHREPAVSFLAGWIVALVTFNFFWNVGDEIFWFQIVPPVWLLLLAWQGKVGSEFISPRCVTAGRLPPTTFAVALAVTVGLLLLVNTENSVAPGADREFEQKKSQHAALFRDGDMEVLPGWDRQKWFSIDKSGPAVERIVLMELALSGDYSDYGMASLPARVGKALQRGNRVIVARLYETDDDLMPWYALRALNWPRPRIKSLLGKFCVRRVTVINGIAFDELTSCELRDDQGDAR